MKLELFTVRDEVAGSSDVILTSKNFTLLKRDLKTVMGSGQKNPITDHFEDKRVYKCGVLDTDTGIISALPFPEFVFSLTEVRDDLIIDIKRAQEIKKSAGLEEAEEGVKIDE